MNLPKKRSYHSVARSKRAAETKERILTAGKELFESKGFEEVTIERIAQAACVSVPTIYALFQSKRGILRALMNEALPPDQFQDLVELSVGETSPSRRLAISAKIARQMYDAEREQMEIFRGATVLAPEFKELENERESRRYHRQEVTIKAMAKEKSLAKGLKIAQARDILWAFTGRDMYRMFVVERGWTSDQYEEWLTQLLIKTLMDPLPK